MKILLLVFMIEIKIDLTLATRENTAIDVHSVK